MKDNYPAIPTPSGKQEPFSTEDYPALEAYLNFYRKWHSRVISQLVDKLKEDSPTATALGESGTDDLLLHSRQRLVLLEEALKTRDWRPYEEHLSDQGINYARQGLEFSTWIKTITFFRQCINPYILDDFPDDAHQVSLIWQGANKLTDLAMAIISQAYFEQKSAERAAERQAKEKALKSLKKSKEKYRILFESLEEKIEERTAELKTINKELESFSYTISHDLRAPLRAINGYANILTKRAGPSLNHDHQRYLGVITESVSKMGALIDDLLLYSRTGRATVNITQVDMNQLVKRVIDDIHEPESDSRISFKTHPLPKVEADWDLLQRVMANLLANAVKFSRNTSQPLIEISGHEEKKQVIYTVKDNGAGFEMEYGHKLFEMFQRLHSEDEYEGTGVGLAIVQRIIHKHGGTAWAQGEPGQGATFSFSIPKTQTK